LPATLDHSPLPKVVTAAATATASATESALPETPRRVRLDVRSSPRAVRSSSVARIATSTIPEPTPPYPYPGLRPSLVIPSQAGYGSETIPTLSAFIGSSSPVKLAPHDQQALSHPRLDSASQKVRRLVRRVIGSSVKWLHVGWMVPLTPGRRSSARIATNSSRGQTTWW
jgi:hypothetical protein